MLAHLARDVCEHFVTVIQLHAKLRVGQGLGHSALGLNRFFFRHSPSTTRSNPEPGSSPGKWQIILLSAAPPRGPNFRGGAKSTGPCRRGDQPHLPGRIEQLWILRPENARPDAEPARWHREQRSIAAKSQHPADFDRAGD